MGSAVFMDYGMFCTVEESTIRDLFNLKSTHIAHCCCSIQLGHNATNCRHLNDAARSPHCMAKVHSSTLHTLELSNCSCSHGWAIELVCTTRQYCLLEGSTTFQEAMKISAWPSQPGKECRGVPLFQLCTNVSVSHSAFGQSPGLLQLVHFTDTNLAGATQLH